VRAACAARIYGWAHAAGVPARAVWANWLNAISTMLAILRYARARLSRQSHVWLKTEHTYPVLESPPAPALEELDPRRVPRLAARALPRHLVERWRVMPCRIAGGSMTLATPHEPPEALRRELKRFTRLQIRFQLVSQENFEQLKAAHL
jgi:hypothetical protein